MKYLSVCSGIEAASVAWETLGFEPVAFSEIEPFPSAVLKHHYPHVPNAGDFTQIQGKEYGHFDILVGGTPCQSFSVAGKRGGLSDERGNLALGYIKLAYRSRPEFLVWENVPGVFSSGKGDDFRCFLHGLTGVDLPVPQKGWKNSGLIVGLDGHYSVAWRVLDAQYFGVPQRRRRVFVVGHLGDWRRAAAVLLERESLLGNPPPSRQARQVAPTTPARRSAGGGFGTDFDCDGGLVVAYGGNNCSGPIEIATAVNACSTASGRLDFESETFVVGRFPDVVPEYYSHDYCQDRIYSTEGVSPALNVSQMHSFAFNLRGREGGALPEVTDVASVRAASGGSSRSYIVLGMAVRRLTPVECERLQGFPDKYTLVLFRNNKPAADGPRYKAIGNSMAVPVMRWIGQRIQMFRTPVPA